MSRIRNAQPEEHDAELLRVFHVEPDDIAANRVGQLGSGQARRLVRSGYVNMVLAVLMSVGLGAIVLAVAARPLKPVQVILSAVLVVALLMVGGVYMVRSNQAAALGVVEIHSGPVHVVMQRRAGYYLTVGDESYKLPVQAWHVQSGASYHVYVVPRARRIVAMEPAW